MSTCGDELLRQLAQAYGIEIIKIAKLARALMLAEIDPIIATGEEFVFISRRPGPKANVDPHDLDLEWFNTEVPEPDACVDLDIAMEEFRGDAENCAFLLNQRPSLEVLRAVTLNQHCWARFWSVRHPKSAVRAYFEHALAAAEPLRQSNAERASRMLERQGSVIQLGERR